MGYGRVCEWGVGGGVSGVWEGGVRGCGRGCERIA